MLQDLNVDLNRTWSKFRRPLLFLSFMICFLAFTPSIHAKDLSNRLGVGFANQLGLSSDLPSLAVRYFPNADYGIMGSLGVDTESNASRFGIQAKIIKVVFSEDNLNFYTAAAAGLISEETNGSNQSGFDLMGVLGVEFFLAGLENLSLNFEAGVGVTSVSSEVRFRTIGDHPFRAGLFFYF